MSDIGDQLDNSTQRTTPGHGGMDFYYTHRCWKCQQRDANDRYHGLCNGCALWLDEEQPAEEPQTDHGDYTWLVTPDFHIHWTSDTA